MKPDSTRSLVTTGLGLVVLLVSLSLSLAFWRSGQEAPGLAMLLAASWLALGVCLSLPLLLYGLMPERFEASASRLLRVLMTVDPQEADQTGVGLVGFLYIMLAAAVGAFAGIWMWRFLGDWSAAIGLVSAVLTLRVLLGSELGTAGVMIAIVTIVYMIPLLAGMYMLVAGGGLGITALLLAAMASNHTAERRAARPASIGVWWQYLAVLSRETSRSFSLSRAAVESQSIVIGVAILVYGLGPLALPLLPDEVLGGFGNTYLAFVRYSIPLLPVFALLMYTCMMVIEGWAAVKTMVGWEGDDDSLWWPLGLAGPLPLVVIVAGPLLPLSTILLFIADSTGGSIINVLLGFFVFPRIILSVIAVAAPILAISIGTLHITKREPRAS